MIVAVEILDVQGATSLVVSELSIRSWLKSLILGSCSSLSVEMLTQVTIWRFQGVNYLWRSTSVLLKGYLSLCVVEGINVVLLLIWMEGLMPGVLVLEYFSQDSFWVTIRILASISLDVHSTTMNSVELVFDVSRGSW